MPNKKCTLFHEQECTAVSGCAIDECSHKLIDTIKCTACDGIIYPITKTAHYSLITGDPKKLKCWQKQDKPVGCAWKANWFESK